MLLHNVEDDEFGIAKDQYSAFVTEIENISSEGELHYAYNNDDILEIITPDNQDFWDVG